MRLVRMRTDKTKAPHRLTDAGLLYDLRVNYELLLLLEFRDLSVSRGNLLF